MSLDFVLAYFVDGRASIQAILRGCASQSRRLALISVLAVMSLCVSALAQTTFSDNTNSSGIMVTGRSFGASWGDLNGDGWPDLWVGNHRALAKIYVNYG